MADYKRMVSYMYQYEDGVKKKNVGYVRVEARNGQCKFTIHLQLLGQLDSVFPTYLIQRNKGDMELVYLGDALLRNQVMDSKMTADANDVMNSGHSLSDMGGLLIFLNERVFFATEWDDKQVIAKEVLAALKPKPKEAEEFDKDSSKIVQVANTFPIINDTKESELNPLTLEEELKIPIYKLPRGYKTIERIQKPIESKESELFERAREAEEAEHFERARVAEEAEHLERAREAEEAEHLERSREAEEMEYLEKSKEAEEAEHLEKSLEAKEAELAETPAMAKEPELFEEPRMAKEPELFEKLLEAADASFENNSDSESKEKPDQQTAKHFFDNYPRIYPFEDNIISNCVKIEPKDIGLLPKEIWALSNNSFLLHGYYCYHHLIFAKIADRNGYRYILGVPGIYHNREKFMARMFGFEEFKSIRKRELRQGDFGYWHLTINL